MSLRSWVRVLLYTRRGLVFCAFAALLTVTQLLTPPPAGARPPTAPARTTPKAPPGAGPVDRPLPASTRANHGFPAAQRPPVVPPSVRAGGSAHRLSPSQWAAQPKPRTAGSARPADGTNPTAGAQNLLLRSGYTLDDTSLVLYFDAVAPGVSNWSSWFATVFDPATGAAQNSAPLAPSDATSCATPRQFCRSFGAADGWSLVDGHTYFTSITVTIQDGTQVVSDPSGTAAARATATPPALPGPQAAGCACGDALAPTSVGQAVRGSGVNTGIGSFTMSWTDLRMAGFGVPFEAVRTYSSGNTGAGTLGVGWAWTYDMRVTPPAQDGGPVRVRAEDGAQAVYQRNADGSYQRPPGIRANLSATADGWRLVSPDQVTYSFDPTGRLTAIRNSRGLGTSVAYPSADVWTITDATGRVVQVSLAAGLVQRITLPDGRSVKYRYSGGLLSAATDADGNTWTFGYTGQLLTTVVDPERRTQITNTYSGGRVVSQSDALGAVTTFSWDPAKQEAKTVDPDGVPFFDGYRGNVLIYSQNGNGDTVNHRYDRQVDPNLLVDPSGNQTTSGYDQAGNVTSVTAPEPFSYTVHSSYDAHNNLTSHTDALGHTATFGYTSFDELTNITDATGALTVLRLDDRGLVTALVDPRGKVTNMSYDAAGNLVSRTTPLGENTTYAYDGTGRPVSTTDPRGNVSGAHPADFTTTFAYDNLDRLRRTQQPGKDAPSVTGYDDLGQLTRTVDPLGDTTTYAYAKVIGRNTAVTAPNGSVTTYTYTKAGRRASITDPGGDKTTYTYDDRGNLSTVVSPRGNVPGANPAQFTTTYTYDFNNNRVRTSRPYPGGGVSNWDTRFDELNRPTATTDPLGRSSTTSYDNNGNVLSTVDPTGATTGYTYDPNGRPTAVTAPAGGGLSSTYDAAGNVTRQTNAVGGVTTWTYDDDGSIATTVDPRGNAAGADPAKYTTKYTYDPARNLTSVTDQLGHATSFGYDAINRITGTTDANGHTTRYRNDDADRLVSVTGPDAVPVRTTNNGDHEYTSTVYKYDSVGHVTARIDPNGHLSQYGFDAVGRLTSVTDPLGRTTTYAYDAESDLTRTVLPGSGNSAARTTTNTYDILDRQVGQDLGGSIIYAYNYDAKNRLTSLADPAGLRLQSYDGANRLTSVSRGDQTYTYAYDADGNITSRQWPDGTRLTARFDAADRMTGLSTQGGVAGSSSYHFAYDASGRLTRTEYPGSGNLVTTRDYDPAGRLTTLASTGGAGTVAEYQIARDPVGNPTAVTTTRGTTSQSVAYTYDTADRATAACVAATACDGSQKGAVTYTYDPVGNRRTQTLTGTAGSGTTRYEYDAADELTAAKTGDNKTTFGYDQQGNQIRAGGDTFTYNLDHTLASATVNGTVTSYSYDAQGYQIGALANAAGGTQGRTWSTDVTAPLPGLTLQTDSRAGTSTTRGFLAGPQHTPLALLSGDRTSQLVPDWLGGVADVVSPSGTGQASYDYDPYGNQRTDGTAPTASSVSSPLRFDGAYQDPTLGSRYSFPARTYDAATGLFGGVDPVAPRQAAPATSAYGFVGDRPTVFVDPSGAKGGNPDHDDAELLARNQLDAQYGPLNVYTDADPARPSLPGRPRTGPGGTICVPTASPNVGEPATSCPDIIVDSGAGTLVYEVKPASDQLSPIRPNLPDRGVANASQVDRYIRSLKAAGYPNVQAGAPIAPDARTYPDGSILTIFPGTQWDQYAQKGKRPAANFSGIIYYNKTKPPRVPVPGGRPTSTPNQQPTEEPTAKPTQQPTTGPVDQPVTSPVGQQVEDAVLTALTIVVIVVVVVVVAVVAVAALGALALLFA